MLPTIRRERGGREVDPEIGRVPGDKVPEQIPERDPRELPGREIDPERGRRDRDPGAPTL
jgi:hypothetical protein